MNNFALCRAGGGARNERKRRGNFIIIILILCKCTGWYNRVDFIPPSPPSLSPFLREEKTKDQEHKVMLQAQASTSWREPIMLCISHNIHSMKCNLASNAMSAMPAWLRIHFAYIQFNSTNKHKSRKVYERQKLNAWKNNNCHVKSDSMSNATHTRRLRAQSQFEETRKMKNLSVINMLHILNGVFTNYLWSSTLLGRARHRMQVKTTQSHNNNNRRWAGRMLEGSALQTNKQFIKLHKSNSSSYI